MFLIYIIYALSTLLSLLMGLLVFFDDTKNKINKIFAVISLSVTGWIATLLMLYSIEDPIYLLWVGRLNFALVLIMLCSLLHFTVIFPYELFKFKKILNISFYWATFFFFVTLFTPLVSKEEIIVLGGGRETIYGSLYWLYIINFIVFTLLSIGLILYKLKKDKENKTRRQSFLFLGGFAISLFIGFITNIALPFLGIYDAQNYGSIAPLFFIASISYAIIKHHLFNIKVVIAELLTFAIWTAVIAQAVMAETINGKILGAVTFVFVIFIGIFLIKSVKKEVAQREHIEKLAEDLVVANEKLKGLDKLKSEFLSLASHQLRSPLTAIKGYTSMLVEGSYGKLEEKQKEIVGHVQSTAQSMISMVEDFLNVSKIEQGGMQYVFVPTDLSKIVANLFEEMKISAESKHLEFALEMDVASTFTVNADAGKLKQVFLNLVDNSIKYTPSGFVHVSLVRSKEKNTVTFSVKDSGVGVSPETKQNLFRKFNRGEGGKLNTGGSGIGLYLAKEITEAHHGEIAIESEGLGKGSLFKVVLPFDEGNKLS